MLKKILGFAYPLALLLLVLAGWFPRSCPVLTRVLSSCPVDGLVDNLTAAQKERERIPHQTVAKSGVVFKVKSQAFRETTAVRFSYLGDYKTQQAYLIMVENSGFNPVALITHPLLTSLDWPRITETLPNTTLFQRDGGFDSLEAFRKALPAKNTFVADKVIAKRWGLTTDQYTPIESLVNLEGVNYIATTYTSPTINGEWRDFDQTFNAKDAFVSTLGELEWQIDIPAFASASEPFLLGLIHVDYKTMR